MQMHGKDYTKTRCARAMQSKAFDGLRRKKLMETGAENFPCRNQLKKQLTKDCGVPTYLACTRALNFSPRCSG